MAIDVRSATRADITPLAATLGRAFHDDPVSVWMLPDDASRAVRMSRYFGTVTRHHHRAGGGVTVAWDDTTAGPTVGAAALWDPPHRWREPWHTRLRMLPGLLGAFGTRVLSAHAVGSLLEANHPEEPHWYLAVIGSDPSVRGRGFGRAVMQPRLNQCDAEHCPAYLESSKRENVPYYERFGFRVTGEIHLPNGGPTLWKMWREPQRPQ